MISNYDFQFNLGSGDVLATSVTSTNELYDKADYVESIIYSIDYNLAAPRFRIFVLHSDDSINYEIPAEDIVLGGSYNENYQDGQRRSLSFSIYNEEGQYTPTINNLWAGTRLRLDAGIQIHDDTTIWFQKGIFIVNRISPSLTNERTTVSIEAGDKFSLFESKMGTIETTYEIDVGENIQNIIESILLLDQGNGEPFDRKPIIYHEKLKDKVTQVKITKSAGDTLGSILLELATQLSAEIFYNAAGNLTIVPTADVDLDIAKPLLYKFNSQNGDFSNLDLTFDMTEIINRIVVIGSTVNGSVCKAIAINDDINSPLCYQRIGLRTGPIINDSNITTDYLAQERADYELRKTLIIDSSTSLNIFYNPLLNVNNIITITNDFYKMVNTKFVIKGISFPIDYSGSMTISISNLKNLSNITQ